MRNSPAGISLLSFGGTAPVASHGRGRLEFPTKVPILIGGTSGGNYHGDVYFQLKFTFFDCTNYNGRTADEGAFNQ